MGIPRYADLGRWGIGRESVEAKLASANEPIETWRIFDGGEVEDEVACFIPGFSYIELGGEDGTFVSRGYGCPSIGHIEIVRPLPTDLKYPLRRVSAIYW